MSVVKTLGENHGDVRTHLVDIAYALDQEKAIGRRET